MLDWNKLVVIATGGSVPNTVKWKASKRIFPAETCMRHVYFGLSEDFSNVSQELLSHKKTVRHDGVQAYEFMVQFYLGLQSQYHADAITTQKVRHDWQTFIEKSTHPQTELIHYMDAIFQDGNLVRESVLKPITEFPTLSNTAIKLARLSRDSRALIICGPQDLSTKVIYALGEKTEHTPDTIFVTHPDGSKLHEIVGEVRKQGNPHKIAAKLHVVDFGKAMNQHPNATTLFNADAIFVCQPMTDDRKSTLGIMNELINESWQLRRMIKWDHDARLLHLRGDPDKQGETSGVWGDSDDLGFISCRSIKDQVTNRLDLTKRIVQRANDAIVQLGALRLSGDEVSDISFDSEHGELPLTYTSVRISGGRALKTISRQIQQADL